MSTGHENGGWMNDDQRGAMREQARKVEACKHEEFETMANIARMPAKEGGPIERYMADIRIQCAQCKVPFRFIGLPAGCDLNGACVSVDACEARLAIAPKGQVVPALEKDAVHGFSVRRTV